MTSLLAAAALVLTSQTVPSPASPSDLPQLTLEQATGLRCGVAFARVAEGQRAGDPAALAFPAMNPRGREFFVRFMAGLMEDPRFTRENVSALALRETRELARGGPEAVAAVMPACLQLLDLSGV